MANMIERKLYSKETVELADRIRNGEDFTEEEVQALPKSERSLIKTIIADRRAGYEKSLKPNKPRSMWAKLIVGATSAIWLILAIPTALSVVGIPFAIFMLIVGGFGVLWALEKEPKHGKRQKEGASS